MQLPYVIGLAVTIGGVIWTVFIAYMSEKYKDA